MVRSIESSGLPTGTPSLSATSMLAMHALICSWNVSSVTPAEASIEEIGRLRIRDRGSNAAKSDGTWQMEYEIGDVLVVAQTDDA